MRKLVATFLVFVAVSASQAQVVTLPASGPNFYEAKKFSVVIERSGLEWRARCDLGCNWKGATLAFACKENCDAILDANGLVTTQTERDPKAAFSFTLSADSGRIYAKPRAGTQWRGLSWSCRDKDPCTATVDEHGVLVSGPKLGRAPGK
jgi:hypothetical protein